MKSEFIESLITAIPLLCDNILRIPTELIFIVFRLLSKDFQDRFRDVSIETERVARYKTQHQLKQQGQNQPEQRSRGVRR